MTEQETAVDLVGLDATEQARRVAAGEVGAETLARAHLARFEAQRHLNALVDVDAEATLAQARAVDEARRRGESLGPLAGVVVTVKDNIDVRGQVTACGSRVHRDGPPAHRDAEVVARLRAAGAVLLGRGNMDELAMGASTQTSAHGPARNPRDPSRSPGGSSGGPAAAVGSRQVALSIGTDTGGSIREPASQCGIVGMAPSPGLVPLAGVAPFAPDLDRVGPLARTVADARLLLDVLAEPVGGGVGDPWAERRGPLRVGVVTELMDAPNRPGVLDRTRAALAALEARGAELVPVSIPEARAALSTYMTLTAVTAVDMLTPYVESGLAGEEIVRRHELGRSLQGGDEPERAAEAARRLRDQLRTVLGRCDLLVSPTMPTTAPYLRDADAEELADPLAAPYTDCWTVVANLGGLPAVSVPFGVSGADHLPVGVMLMGVAGSDAGLLDVAAELEGPGLEGTGLEGTGLDGTGSPWPTVGG